MLEHERHGVRNEDTADVLAQLGVREHTDEDCRVSELLHLAAGAPVVAEGTAVYVLREGAWTRYRITAGDRRRIAAGASGRRVAAALDGLAI
jgi:hypothetical protein